MKTFLRILFFFFLVTQMCFAQWVQIGLNDKSFKEIVVQNSNIFAITSDSGSIYRSTDNGSNWTMIIDSCAFDISISPSGKIFVLKDSVLNMFPNYLYSSVDNGNTWTEVNLMAQLIDSIPDLNEPISITVSPTGIVFCGIRQGRKVNSTAIAKSDDDGLIWTTPGMRIRGGDLFDFRGQFVITNGHSMAPGAAGSYIYLSTDFGNTWDLLGYPPWTFINSLGFFSNGNMLIGGMGIHISTDICSTWTQIATLNIQSGLSWSSGLSEGMLFGTEDLGVFLFSDNGDSLGSINEGLSNLNVHTLTLDNNGYVYAGTGNGVWRRPLTEIVTSIEEEPTQPAEFLLTQNFPNPFNPATKIKYSIPKSSQVTVKIFNTLGEEIEILVSEEKPVGTYEVNWNAANLPSGIYFYRLQAGSFIQTRKMILLK